MFGVAQPRGSWKEIENQDVRSQRFPTCQITCLALLAIGMLVIGYLGANTFVGFCGLGMVAGLLFFGGVLYCQAKKVEGIYMIASWNLKKQEVGNAIFNEENNIAEVIIEQIQASQQALNQFKHCDLLLLQNTGFLDKDNLEKALPPEFSYFRSQDHSLVAWKKERFSLISHVHLDYLTRINPSAITLLKDNVNETILCIGSAEVASFPLNEIKQEKDIQKRKALFRAREWSNSNCQLRYDLETMKAVSADLYIYAGLECIQEQDVNQQTLIKNYHYFTDPLNAHIFAKSGSFGVLANIRNFNSKSNSSLSDFTPVFAVMAHSYRPAFL